MRTLSVEISGSVVSHKVVYFVVKKMFHVGFVISKILNDLGRNLGNFCEILIDMTNFLYNPRFCKGMQLTFLNFSRPLRLITINLVV